MTSTDRDADLRDGPVVRAGGQWRQGMLGVLLIGLAALPLSVLVSTGDGPVVRFDERVSAAAERAVAGSELLLVGAQATTLLGEPLLATLASAGLALLLWRRGHSRLALLVLASRLGASVLSTGLKVAVGRTRPVFDEPVATALGAAFPSGHALAASAFWATAAVVVAHFVGRRVALLTGAIAIALVVCVSRVLLGVHYPSDVLAGLLLGLGWTAVCSAVLTSRRREAAAGREAAA